MLRKYQKGGTPKLTFGSVFVPKTKAKYVRLHDRIESSRYLRIPNFWRDSEIANWLNESDNHFANLRGSVGNSWALIWTLNVQVLEPIYAQGIFTGSYYAIVFCYKNKEDAENGVVTVTRAIFLESFLKFFKPPSALEGTTDNVEKIAISRHKFYCLTDRSKMQNANQKSLKLRIEHYSEKKPRYKDKHQKSLKDFTPIKPSAMLAT